MANNKPDHQMRRMPMRLSAMVTVVAVALVLGYTAQADVNVNPLSNSWGIYAWGQTVGGTYINSGTLIQLVWSPDNAISPLAVMNPNMLDASEKLMFTTNGPDSGGWGLSVFDLDGSRIYTDASFGVGLAGGFVYCRIFDQASPAPGGHYFDSGLYDAKEWTNVPPEVTSVDVAPGQEDPGFAVNQTIPVPEPLSLALFGVGLVSLAIRRLRRK
jgi:hypothetical protein